MLKMNQDTYKKIIDEDLTWLKFNTEDSLERQHIIVVLNNSINSEYSDLTKQLANSKAECDE